MSERLPITKTYKLFIGGKFPRTESGRSTKCVSPDGTVLAHLCHASRKDLRAAVEAARKAQHGWAAATGYLRSQILYRMAEMMEGKKDEFAHAIDQATNTTDGATEVNASIDRLIGFAGWADKYAQALGCNNQVSGPYYNFTTAEPTGVVAVVCPDESPLLGLISLLAPVICSGNTAIVLASESNPIPASILGEVCATSDLPAGVVNILTGFREELLTHITSHRGIDAVHAANLSPEHSTLLREGAAENLKRVTVRALEDNSFADDSDCESPWWIEPFVEFKTIWHPSAT